MPVDGIDNGAEIHIGNGKRGILFKAGGEHEQQITELINVLDVCRRKVLPDKAILGKYGACALHDPEDERVPDAQSAHCGSGR